MSGRIIARMAALGYEQKCDGLRTEVERIRLHFGCDVLVAIPIEADEDIRIGLVAVGTAGRGVVAAALRMAADQYERLEENSRLPAEGSA